MPSVPKVVSGARCKVFIGGSGKPGDTSSMTLVGIFNSVSFGLGYGAQPVYILGRYSPAEIDYTDQDVVGITCTGWRVVGHGPHADGKVPMLQNLLHHDYISLAVHDRATGKLIASISSVRPTGYSTTISNRQLEEITVNFVGIMISDETADNDESAGASDLPQD